MGAFVSPAKQVKYLNRNLKPRPKQVKAPKIKPFNMKKLSPTHHRFTRGK